MKRLIVVLLSMALLMITMALAVPTTAVAADGQSGADEDAQRGCTSASWKPRLGQSQKRTGASPFRHLRDHRTFFHISPTVAAPGTIGNIGLNADSASPDADFVSQAQDLQFGAGLGLEVGFCRISLAVDFLSLHQSLGGDNGQDLELYQFVTDAAVHWTYQPATFLQIGPRAGVRHFFVRGAFEEAQQNRNWLDPIVGVQGRLSFADLVYLPFRGDVGGIAFAPRVTMQGYAGIGLNVGAIEFELGYRHLYADFETNDFNYDLSTTGPQFRTTFRF